MTRRLRDLPRFPLREHGSSERVERIWRRLGPELGQAPVWSRAQTFWALAALVSVFAFGVYVGARWVRPDVVPTLSAERAVSIEPALGPQTAPPVPAGSTHVAPRVVPPQRARSSGIASPVIELAAPSNLALPVASSAPIAMAPAWELLAEAGDFEAARTALDAQGGFESVLGTATAPQLMTLVDIGRASGSRERAVAALRRVVEFFRDAPEAPLAAWTLGNMLDQAGDEPGASEAYALYRRLSPGGDFAEDALAREVDSALTQGNLELTARLIAQYENEFPNGRRLEEFRSELARRSERTVAPTPGDDEPATPPEVALEPARGDASSGKAARPDDAAAQPSKPLPK
jgi:hypothetical protein